MANNLTIAAAQLGPIVRDEPRSSAVARMIALMSEAKSREADLVVFPELALTTFFPRWFIKDQAEIDSYFETEMPGPDTRLLFEAAINLGIGFYLGYAELVEQDGQVRHFNTSILVNKSGEIAGKYRKVHLPGHREYEAWRPFQHLEKRYFDTGNLGFPTFSAFGGILGMCICNDRRWPETFRVMGLQGWNLCCWAIILRFIIHRRRSTITCRTFTTILSCRPAPIRTAPGWLALPRPDARKAAI